MCDYFFLYSIANGKVEQVTMKKTTMKKIVKPKIAKQTQNLSLIWMLIYQVRLIHVML
jgi:hypothetical protein